MRPGFRELIFFFTWLATGHTQFGQQGHQASLHLAFLGIWFVLLIPVLGGLLYGSSAPLDGYEIVDLIITPDSLAAGHHIADVPWPRGPIVVSVTDGGEITPALPSMTLSPGERVVLPAPTRANGESAAGPTR